MDTPIEVSAALGAEEPLFVVRSRTPRSRKSVRGLLVAAGLFGVFAALCFFVMLPLGLAGELHTEGGAPVKPLTALFLTLGAGSMMTMGGAGFLFLARQGSRPPGPWYAATPTALVVVQPRRTLRIPWGAFDTATVDDGTVVLQGRVGLKLGDTVTQDKRQILEIVDAPEAEHVAQVCAQLVAAAKPKTLGEKVKAAFNLDAASQEL